MDCDLFDDDDVDDDDVDDDVEDLRDTLQDRRNLWQVHTGYQVVFKLSSDFQCACGWFPRRDFARAVAERNRVKARFTARFTMSAPNDDDDDATRRSRAEAAARLATERARLFALDK